MQDVIIVAIYSYNSSMQTDSIQNNNNQRRPLKKDRW